MYIGRCETICGNIVAEVVYASSCVCSWCVYFVKCVQWHAWFASLRHPWGSHSRFLKVYVFCSYKCLSPDYNWDTLTHSGGEECRGTRRHLLQEVSQEICILRHTRANFQRLIRKKKRSYLAKLEAEEYRLFLWQDGKWACRIFYERKPSTQLTSCTIMIGSRVTSVWAEMKWEWILQWYLLKAVTYETISYMGVNFIEVWWNFIFELAHIN